MVRKQRNKGFAIGPWLFAFFVTAGLYKADPHLAFIQQLFDITVLFFLLSFGSFLVQWIRHWFRLSLPKTFWYAFGAFLWVALVLLMGAVVHDNLHYGLQKALRFLILTGWAFLGVALIVTDYNKLKQFAWALLVVATTMGISTFVEWCSGKFVWFGYGLSTNYLGTGRIAGIGLITVIAFLLTIVKSFWIRFTLLVDSVLLFWVVFVTGGRGPAVSFVISVLVFLALNRKVRKYLRNIRVKRYLKLTNALVLVGLVVVGVKGPQWFPVLFSRLKLMLERGGHSLLTRAEYMHMALNIFEASPLLGMGSGALGKEFVGLDVRLYPHNIFFELAAEGGIVALSMFVILLWLAYRNGFKYLRLGVIPVYLITISLFMFLNAMVSGDINDNRMLFMFLGLLTVVRRLALSQGSNFLRTGVLRDR